MKKPTHPIDNTPQQEVLSYFSSGRHMFVACDDREFRSLLTTNFKSSSAIEPLSTVDATDAASLEQFVQDVVESCSELVRSIGGDFSMNSQSLAGYLSSTQECFRKKQRQGFLVVNHIHCILAMQSTIEIEGPFREVMQFYDHVAIAWLGSRDWMIKIQQYDRPFYLSHRTFWL